MINGKLFINGQWIDGTGQAFTSTNPADNTTVYEGAAATSNDVNLAVQAARNAFEPWADLTTDQRIAYIETFRDLLEQKKPSLAQAISHDMGKPVWRSWRRFR